MIFDFDKVYSDMKQGCLIISCTALEDGNYPAYWPDENKPNQFISEEIFQTLAHKSTDCVEMVLKPLCGFEKPHKFVVCFESKKYLELSKDFLINYEDKDLIRKLTEWSPRYETATYVGSSSFQFLQDYCAVKKPLYKLINLGENNNGIEIAVVDAEVYEKIKSHFLYESVSIDSYEFVGGNKDNKWCVTFSNDKSFCVFEGLNGIIKPEYEVEPYYMRHVKEYLKR